jgi:hypothetical protein
MCQDASIDAARVIALEVSGQPGSDTLRYFEHRIPYQAKEVYCETLARSSAGTAEVGDAQDGGLKRNQKTQAPSDVPDG